MSRSRLWVVLVAVAVVAVVAMVVSRRAPEGPGVGHGSGPVASDTVDDQVVAFVYDTLVLQAAQGASRACPMPTRQASGLLKVKTELGRVVLVGWTYRRPPEGWSEESQRCVADAFSTLAGTPGFKVPAGREYELDVDLTFPPPQGVGAER